MKCSVFVATVACVLSVTLASSAHKVVQAHSEVASHVEEQMSGIHMMRASSAHMECYNSFVPSIESLANRAKSDSQVCVNNASAAKDQKLEDIKTDRANIDAQVQRIQEALNDCNTKSGLAFFQCLAAATEANTQLLNAIKEHSDNLITDFSNADSAINRDEKTCLRTVVDVAKSAADNQFKDLRSCLSIDSDQSPSGNENSQQSLGEDGSEGFEYGGQ